MKNKLNEQITTLLNRNYQLNKTFNQYQKTLSSLNEKPSHNLKLQKQQTLAYLWEELYYLGMDKDWLKCQLDWQEDWFPKEFGWDKFLEVA